LSLSFNVAEVVIDDLRSASDASCHPRQEAFTDDSVLLRTDEKSSQIKMSGATCIE
jgi:hypothetical protein